MKLIAIIATAAMAVGFYSYSEASPVSAAKDVVICEQQNNGVQVCSLCNGSGKGGSNMPCSRCRGRGIVRSNGMPL